MGRIWPWLLPGLGIKRWVLLLLLGVVVMGYGLAMLLLRLQAAQASGASGAVIIGGFALGLAAIYRLVRSIIHSLHPGGSGVAFRLYQHRQLDRGPRVVAIGGGTGLPSVLRGLKEYTGNITAIVTVTDDGGSSGKLRSQFGILPPGDIRNCLVALSDTEPLLERLFQYRFQQGDGLAGHSFGNLFILALTETTGDFYRAIQKSSQVLAVRGRVVPSSLEQVQLQAELTDGRVLAGESVISRAADPILRVRLEPPAVRPVADALEAIRAAELIVIGPGSLFTSIIPNLLIPGIAEAIRQSPAPKLFVCNIMTQPGETYGLTASQHVKAVIAHAGSGCIDYVIVNTGNIPRATAEHYLQVGARPVAADVAELKRLGIEVFGDDLVELLPPKDGDEPAKVDLVRHHPAKLAAAISRIAMIRQPWPGGAGRSNQKEV